MTITIKAKIFIYLAFIFVTIFAYWYGAFGFFIGDDYVRIIHSEHYLNNGYISSLTNILPDRPLLMATIWLNYIFSGINPLSYKIVSIGIHIIVVILFFNILLHFEDQFFKKRRLNLIFCVSILFLVHPVNSQAVLSIIQRGVLMATMGGLGAYLFYIKYLKNQKRFYFFLSFLFFIVGIFSKPIIITLPLILIIHLQMINKLNSKNLLKLSLFILPCLYPLFFYLFFKVNDQSQLGALPWQQYLIIQAKVILIYFKLFLVPINLHFFHEIDHKTNFFDFIVWSSILIHFIIISLGIYLIKNKKFIGLGIIGTYLALIPESSFFPIRHLAFEHRTYFPYIFLCLLVYGLFDKFHQFLTPRKLPIISIFFFIVIVSYTSLLRTRTLEIDTFDKWALNSYKYQHPTKYNKTKLLDNLYASNNYLEGVKYSNKFANEDPSYGPYRIYNIIFESYQGNNNYKRESIEKVANFLIFKNNPPLLDVVTLNNFLTYIINQIPKFVKNKEIYHKKIELLFRNQLAITKKKYRELSTIAGVYLRNLRALSFIFLKKEKNNDLSAKEKIQFAHVIGQLMLFDKEKSKSKILYLNLFNRLKNKNNSLVNRISNIEKNYLAIYKI